MNVAGAASELQVAVFFKNPFAEIPRVYAESAYTGRAVDGALQEERIHVYVRLWTILLYALNFSKSLIFIALYRSGTVGIGNF